MKKSLIPIVMAAAVLASCDHYDRADGHAVVLGNSMYATPRPLPPPAVRRPAPKPVPAPAAVPAPKPAVQPPAPKPVAAPPPPAPKPKYAVMPGQNRGLHVRPR